jgi:uncharacterized protein YutE (UPF0331/DUF86 family)
MKHWTEPNGIFIINIPIEWQYKNVVVSNGLEKSPYSFEPYENAIGCFQLSCYPLSEKGHNPNFPIQKNNSEVEWLVSRMDDENFDMLLFHAQVDDQLCMAKYIYSAKQRKNNAIKEQLNKVHSSLKTFRVIPNDDRLLASNLNKYDNFLTSLLASYDLFTNAYKTESYIEMIVILANQIDAFLRLAIVLKEQLTHKTNDIEVKYLFQGDKEKAIMERTIYSDSFKLEIIDKETFEELNNLYNQRNRIIHRYIISLLKTRDIIKIAHDYILLSEKVRLILEKYEDMQFGQGFGIYGTGFTREKTFDKIEYQRAYSMANDKHLIKKLKRKLQTP